MRETLRERVFEAPDGVRFDVRPLEESDEGLIGEFRRREDREDIRLRFFASIRTFDHQFLWPLVHYDHEQAVAYVALDGHGDVAGVGRLHCDVLRTFGEFAMIVGSHLKHEGLGSFLMTMLIDWAKARSIPLIKGEVLHENAAMLALCRHFGFRIYSLAGDPSVKAVELEIVPG